MDDTKRASTDVIAALHHPVRRRLIELLNVDGPATVSALATASGERVGNVSHHLKVLANAGLVAEAPELARDRREHWWRDVRGPIAWSRADIADDDAFGQAVVSAAEQQNLTHQTDKVHQWFAHRDDYDSAWGRAAFSVDSWIEVTPEELAELGRRINATIGEYLAGRDEATEQSRQIAFVFAHGIPARP